jgi:hypothetical protein
MIVTVAGEPVGNVGAESHRAVLFEEATTVRLLSFRLALAVSVVLRTYTQND